MNRKTFFDEVRPMFGGTLTSTQVMGMENIIDAFDAWGTGVLEHLAYILATAYHETGRRMYPVREGFASSDSRARAAVKRLFDQGRISKNYALPGSYGNSFYGRGVVQLTHESNYRRMGEIIGVDLVKYPDAALDFKTSARILVEGCLRAVSLKGDFTSYALEDFINSKKVDYVQARKVVNGLDKASTIAWYAEQFESALTKAGYVKSSKKSLPSVQSQGNWKQIIGFLIAAAVAAGVFILRSILGG